MGVTTLKQALLMSCCEGGWSWTAIITSRSIKLHKKRNKFTFVPQLAIRRNLIGRFSVVDKRTDIAARSNVSRNAFDQLSNLNVKEIYPKLTSIFWQKTNRKWFSVVCTFVDNDICHHKSTTFFITAMTNIFVYKSTDHAKPTSIC